MKTLKGMKNRPRLCVAEAVAAALRCSLWDVRPSRTPARAGLSCSRYRLGHLHQPVQVRKCGDPNRGRVAHKRWWRPLAASFSPLARRACYHIASLAYCSGDLLPVRLCTLCSYRQAPRSMFIDGGFSHCRCSLPSPRMDAQLTCSLSRSNLTTQCAYGVRLVPYKALLARWYAEATRDEVAAGCISTCSCRVQCTS